MATSAVRRPEPTLAASRTPSNPAGVVLVLRGGGERGRVPVNPTQLSLLRMVPVAVVGGQGPVTDASLFPTC
jgi:hypothetical protein